MSEAPKILRIAMPEEALGELDELARQQHGQPFEELKNAQPLVGLELLLATAGVRGTVNGVSLSDQSLSGLGTHGVASREFLKRMPDPRQELVEAQVWIWGKPSRRERRGKAGQSVLAHNFFVGPRS